MSCLKNRLLVLVLISFFLVSYSKNAKADFFDACNISNNDKKNIDFVVKNGNSQYIPNEIDEIQNNNFKKALYLYLFYRDNKNLPEDIVNIIGFNNIKYLYKFRNFSLNYILKNGNLYDIKSYLNEIEANNADCLFVLKNKYFQEYNFSNDFIIFLLKKATFNNILSYNDILFLKSKYKQFSDIYILQQIRLLLWKKRYNEAKNIAKLLDKEFSKNLSYKLFNFYDIYNKKQAVKIRTKNGKIITKYRNNTKAKLKSICEKQLGIDEYIDLTCLENDKNNVEYIARILNENLNPIFLPDKWIIHRLFLSRELMNNNELEKAYIIIENSGDLKKENFYTQNFFAGLLSYLQEDYEKAILHFNKCANISKYVEYSSKANYWLGLSYLKFGNRQMAEQAFYDAQERPITMYGQLALEELNKNPEEEVLKYINSFTDENSILCDDINFIVYYFDQFFSQKQTLRVGMSLYANSRNSKEKLFNALSVINKDFFNLTAKSFAIYAMNYGIVFGNISYPLNNINDDSLVNAVIKKESNFKHMMIGSCGERGLMQIMPSTARLLSNLMNIKYDKNKLLNNEYYNVKMGHFYLDSLLNKFDNHKLLALSAYNAGSGNVLKWIKKNGDPRDFKTNEEIVMWIEKIPFSYTRSYSTQILGSEMVYDALKKLS